MGCFRYISVNTLHKGDDDDDDNGKDGKVVPVYAMKAHREVQV
jgi:hypothetical protein